MREWLVVADDRTGAFEVAALFAQVIGPVSVTVGVVPAESGVVDIGSRALSSAAAAKLAAAIDYSPSSWIAHKIDSTLRGNWAVELVARQRSTGRRVVVLPGWPEMRRTCVGGVVHVDGVPIGSVLDHLSGELLADANELREWLSGDGEIAVCDIPDSQAMHAAASVLVGHDVLVAGPAGPLGAVFAAARAPSESHTTVTITGPLMVVCGSANSVAREQVRRLRAVLPQVEVVATSQPDGELHEQAVVALAERARMRMREVQPATVVIVGGETAAVLLDNTVQVVAGFAAPGMPFIRSDGRGPLVITKAGGFGGPDALVELLRGENG